MASVTVRYRKTGGEVIKISRAQPGVPAQTWADLNPTYWGVLSNPALPDGDQVRDWSTNPPGPMRTLGLAKIAIPGTKTVRNATAAEIAAWADAETEDQDAQDVEQAQAMLDHPRFGRALMAVLDEAEQMKPAGQRRTRDQIKAAVRGRVRR